ncbi:hypothetical protein VIN01S_34710 [Vibrio inusitatus NBRC 102082]|uniref:Uncharacterized protein n=1 Tax=Vibrio inusitatus NBRC 102082 TaxID=1219070 RepID=A0A4Y3HZT8_9VIBR|nr:hypothetical protein VIN01S_34710 [Vibrio inusitatus NBRC 102082]
MSALIEFLSNDSLDVSIDAFLLSNNQKTTFPAQLVIATEKERRILDPEWSDVYKIHTNLHLYPQSSMRLIMLAIV